VNGERKAFRPKCARYEGPYRPKDYPPQPSSQWVGGHQCRNPVPENRALVSIWAEGMWSEVSLVIHRSPAWVERIGRLPTLRSTVG